MPDKVVRTTPERLPAVVSSLVTHLSDKLGDTNQLRHEYAVELLRQAQRNAVKQPTPQARMTASGMQVRRGAVLGFPRTHVLTAGVSKPMGGFSYGSEFGSNQFGQFAPRKGSGYWLNPSVDQVDDSPGERFLDRVIDDSLRGIR